ncbi:hypothetical protein BDW74DRAFT_152913 [Aspergillus multicolor]|uniref:uncharacterized protein n=1 Tax=Aspergillus multicolor TaxID=41759 RepID=UPI003CCE3EBC
MSHPTPLKDLENNPSTAPSKSDNTTTSKPQATLFDLHPNNFFLQKIYRPIHRNLSQCVLGVFACWILYYQTCTRYFGCSEETCDFQVYSIMIAIQMAFFVGWCYVAWLQQK